jgi:kynurenine formamidase
MPIKKIFLWRVVLSVAAFSSVWSGEEPSLWQIQQVLAGKRYVDLTHEFATEIPHSPGCSRRGAQNNYWYDKRPNVLGTGFFSELYTHDGQWGTDVDSPAHFIKGLRTVDQIDLKEMVLPLVVIDVHDEAAKNPDYTLSLERVKRWKQITDQFLPVCLLRCAPPIGRSAGPTWQGWQTRMPTVLHIIPDGVCQVPEAGAIAVVSFPKPKGGSGFPARVFAILP